jgi:hypothetical protein
MRREVPMTRVIGGLSLLLVSASVAQARGLPSCRVRVVKSALTEAISTSLFKQVESWANAPDRGSKLVPTINDADVLLEVTAYKPRTLSDGTPGEQWWFTARRLTGSSPERSVYRFGYLIGIDPQGQGLLAKQLPGVLDDVCLGYLPKVASGR